MDRHRTAALVLVVLTGCATRGPTLAPHLPGGASSPPTELESTPFFAQEAYQCGPAALATTLQASGVPVTPEELVREVYLPARRGSLQVELIASARRHGRLAYPVEPSVSGLLAEVAAGRPVLVLQNLGLESYPIWHYAVVIGFDPARDTILLRSGTRRRQEVSAHRFLQTWEAGGSWGIVLLRPGELPALPSADTYVAAVAPLEELGQVQSAERGYRTGLTLWPGEELLWLGLGNTLYAQGERVEAEAAFREAVTAAPEHAIARNNLAQVLSERGCHGEALSVLRPALRSSEITPQLRAALLDTQTEILRRERRSRQQAAGCDAALP